MLTRFRGARLHKRVQRDTGRYLVFCILVLSLFSMGSGITFIPSLLLLFFWGGVTGNSFINRSLGRVLGGQSGSPLLLTATG